MTVKDSFTLLVTCKGSSIAKSISMTYIPSPWKKITSERTPKPSTYLLSLEESTFLDFPPEEKRDFNDFCIDEKFLTEEDEKAKALLNHSKKQVNSDVEYQIVLTKEVIYYLKIIQDLRPIQMSQLFGKMVKLPVTQFKKTLVLDLDGTLAYVKQRAKDNTTSDDSTSSPTKDSIQKVEHIYISDGEEAFSQLLEVLLRPGLKEFLESMRDIYEIVVKTSY